MSSPPGNSLPSNQVQTAATPSAPSREAEEFYRESIRELHGAGHPFLVAGTYALSAYTGISRPTKDLDILCKPSDFPRILGHFRDKGWMIEVEDDRWIGKVLFGDFFFDIIFASASGTIPVNGEWFDHAQFAEVLGIPVRIVSPTEMIWSKSFIQLRHRYDGPDIMHMILRQHERINWQRLLANMELHWEILLAHLLNFRWIYPTERDHVPRWLMEELLDRARQQLDMPLPQVRICRGPMLSRFDYLIDTQEWGFNKPGQNEG